MKKIIFLFLLLNYCPLFSQNDGEEQAIRATIAQLFDGMRAGDSTLVRAVFDPAARLQSAFYDKEGNSILRTGSIDRFVEAIDTPHDDVWDEKIWSLEVRIDGPLATAWTEYTFFLGQKMSHCGVNAFHLFKSRDGWKITQITDTRRKENCQED